MGFTPMGRMVKIIKPKYRIRIKQYSMGLSDLSNIAVNWHKK
jgi:hypothetical protein